MGLISCELLNLFVFTFFFLAVNRRLDEWVKLEQLDLDSVEAVVDEKPAEEVIAPDDSVEAIKTDLSKSLSLLGETDIVNKPYAEL